MRNLLNTEIAQINAQLSSAVSLASAHTARVTREPCGYRIARATVEYSESDLAWFRAPIKGC